MVADILCGAVIGFKVDLGNQCPDGIYLLFAGWKWVNFSTALALFWRAYFTFNMAIFQIVLRFEPFSKIRKNVHLFIDNEMQISLVLSCWTESCNAWIESKAIRNNRHISYKLLFQEMCLNSVRKWWTRNSNGCPCWFEIWTACDLAFIWFT